MASFDYYYYFFLLSDSIDTPWKTTWWQKAHRRTAVSTPGEHAPQRQQHFRPFHELSTATFLNKNNRQHPLIETELEQLESSARTSFEVH